MQIEGTSGSDPLLNRPPATTDRPSGDAEATERAPDVEARETDRRDNLESNKGAKIDVLA